MGVLSSHPSSLDFQLRDRVGPSLGTRWWPVPCSALPGLHGQVFYFLKIQGAQVPVTSVAWYICLSGLSSHAHNHQNDSTLWRGGRAALHLSRFQIHLSSFFLSLYLFIYLLLVLKTKIVPRLVHLMREDSYEEP